MNKAYTNAMVTAMSSDAGQSGYSNSPEVEFPLPAHNDGSLSIVLLTTSPTISETIANTPARNDQMSGHRVLNKAENIA